MINKTPWCFLKIKLSLLYCAKRPRFVLLLSCCYPQSSLEYLGVEMASWAFVVFILVAPLNAQASGKISKTLLSLKNLHWQGKNF